MTDLRQSVLDAFARHYGRDATGVWSAPGRVNLIGEHTDYNSGFVLPFAIDRRTVIALGTSAEPRARVTSAFSEETVELPLQDIGPDAVHGWAAYPLGIVWALRQLGADLSAVSGFDVYIDSSVPIGAGLSSSAAIECAVAVALNDIWRLGFDHRTLAEAGQLAENRVVGAPTGIMDQSASLFGRADAAVFLDCRSLHSEVIPLGFGDAGVTALIIDSGVDHEHATGGYSARRASCETGARMLGVDSLRDVSVDALPRAREVLDDETFRRVRHVVTENQRVLDTVRTLRESGPRAIGELLHASHRSMRDDFEISVPELDLAVETAQAAGAIGARMTGGGFGGAAIALVPVEEVSRVESEVSGAFAEHGYASPAMFQVAPSDGARRDLEL